MYIQTITKQYPVSEQDIRNAYPNTSFSNPFIAPDEYVWVFPAPQPTLTDLQLAREIAPILTSKGHYEQQWEVADMFQDIEDKSKAEQEVEHLAKLTAERSKALQANITAGVQSRLDTFAATRNYDGILSACTYATSTIPKFQAEGQYCVNARDASWAKLYQITEEVLAGTRPMPSGYSDIEVELPTLVWPE